MPQLPKFMVGVSSCAPSPVILHDMRMIVSTRILGKSGRMNGKRRGCGRQGQGEFGYLHEHTILCWGPIGSHARPPVIFGIICYQ